MGRQRNRPQIKEQENSPGEELDEMEASNLSDSLMIIRIFNSMKEDTESIKKERVINKECNI